MINSKTNTSEQIRQKFIDYWNSDPRNAKQVPNASLVPLNDPTLLFVNSGMFPLVPYLGGEPHPLGTRLFNVQRCIRTIDIDEVGDYNHLVLFEMIGNWSLGDFTKAEQIPWMLKLYVEEFGLDINRLYVSVWGGNDEIPRDDEAIELWVKAFKEYGITAKFSDDLTNVPQGDEPSTKDWEFRIFPYGKSDNWWQRGPDTPGELGGPSSELFYDMGSILYETNEAIHINDDSGRYLEVGNNVFMEYKFTDDGKWVPMEQKNIDYGGGLDRIISAAQGKRSIYETDLFEPILNKIEMLSGNKYNPEVLDENLKSFRVVAEHARSSSFILADGVAPSGKDQGYILRRLIRRMIRHGMKLGIEDNFTKDLAIDVIGKMEGSYPHLKENEVFIIDEIEKEEIKFRRTLDKGVKEIEKMIENDSNFKLNGETAFFIYETYGFPLEMSLEEFGITEVSEVEKITKEFNLKQEEHKAASRAGAEGKFKGGLADSSNETTKLHTTHHLLLKALQMVLGEDVKQRGSNITGERLRIDFSYDSKLTPEQVEEVEKIVNEKIEDGLKVERVEMPKADAEKVGAEMEFGQKYPDIVSVYVIGDSVEDAFSKEFCGGPHVDNTSVIGEGGKKFKIKKQENIGSGLRRIKGVLV
ncbi:MAG: alanine--tRNA ligase [Candidatus Dojkabacteria bacterium]|nr:alanine--tRNA ligase [Candidatus Dojkabacteria bacterium]MDQ7021848.1 alanine--tRNA ligase [Candidatus Dojkabacteria bacterium]